MCMCMFVAGGSVVCRGQVGLGAWRPWPEAIITVSNPFVLNYTSYYQEALLQRGQGCTRLSLGRRALARSSSSLADLEKMMWEKQKGAHHASVWCTLITITVVSS